MQSLPTASLEAQPQPVAECLVSRTFPDRRRATAQGVDLDPTCPARRAADADVIRPAACFDESANAKRLASIKQDGRRRFLAEPERITAMGEFDLVGPQEIAS